MKKKEEKTKIPGIFQVSPGIPHINSSSTVYEFDFLLERSLFSRRKPTYVSIHCRLAWTQADLAKKKAHCQVGSRILCCASLCSYLQTRNHVRSSGRRSLAWPNSLSLMEHIFATLLHGLFAIHMSIYVQQIAAVYNSI